MPTVLIVDDEQHLRLLIEQPPEELEDHGVQLQTAGDGEETVGVVEIHKPALVFLGVMMPKKNGFGGDTLTEEPHGTGLRFADLPRDRGASRRPDLAQERARARIDVRVHAAARR